MRQKEALKALRSAEGTSSPHRHADPAYLGLALEGLREFSVIATAPQKRLAIKTFVQRHRRHHPRGGDPGVQARQVLFPAQRGRDHRERPRVAGKLVPEARIVIGHGQLPERELERVMRDFTTQKANLLPVHHHHRNRHRQHPDRQHHHHQPRRPLRFRPASPAARPRRTGSHHQAYAYLPPTPTPNPPPRPKRLRPSSR